MATYDVNVCAQKMCWNIMLLSNLCRLKIGKSQVPCFNTLPYIDFRKVQLFKRWLAYPRLILKFKRDFPADLLKNFVWIKSF